MSPEQAAGEAVDHRSDLFSLGSVLYAACTGRPPFRAGGAHAVIKRVIDDAPPPIPELNPAVPGWLCDLIARLHAKDPAGRVPSAQDVADVLGQHLARLQQPGPAALPEPVERRPPDGPVRKRRRAAPIAALLVLLGLGGGLFVADRAGWLGRSPEPSQARPSDPKPVSPPPTKAPPVAEPTPAAKEVLDELRRLVAVQEEHFRHARANFDAGRGSPLDFCAAEVLLIEARIKLATAEQTSVTALLGDLVRSREEELRIARERFNAGAAAEAEVLSAQARLSEARARLATARAAAPDGTP
jgi:hypothetical protein